MTEQTSPDFAAMEDGGRWWIHEHAHSYGLNVVRDPALAHRYVVWVQPTWDEASRFETRMHWGDKSAFVHAAALLFALVGESLEDAPRKYRRGV